MRLKEITEILDEILEIVDTVDCPECGSDFETQSADEDDGCNSRNCLHFWRCKRDHETHKKVESLKAKLHSVDGKGQFDPAKDDELKVGDMVRIKKDLYWGDIGSEFARGFAGRKGTVIGVSDDRPDWKHRWIRVQVTEVGAGFYQENVLQKVS